MNNKIKILLSVSIILYLLCKIFEDRLMVYFDLKNLDDIGIGVTDFKILTISDYTLPNNTGDVTYYAKLKLFEKNNNIKNSKFLIKESDLVEAVPFVNIIDTTGYLLRNFNGSKGVILYYDFNKGVICYQFFFL